jgi:hypothetical protein
MCVRIAVLLALVLAPVAGAQLVTSAVDTNHTVVHATGQARQAMVPDRASVTILVDAQAMSADEASTRLASIERAVLDTLRRMGLADAQAYNSGVVPFRQPGMPSGAMGGPTFSGRSTIRVDVTRLDRISAITSAALAKGATFIAPPSFTSSGADSIRRVLLPRALEQAQRDAESLARAAGGRLGRLLDVSTQVTPVFPDQASSMIYASTMYYDSGPRPLPNTTVTASVSARWLLIRGAP